ncbi:glycoside hydrolase family 16 protein [Candidatus Saccharibacteria bacterium]|nr:glycoside hydrolase family 16 protein [Candidatus Saccharibacteria bacterium]
MVMVFPRKDYQTLREKIKGIRMQGTTRQITLAACVIAFGFVGYYLLSITRAAPVTFSSEAETGTLSANATQVSDSQASGGSAVKFTAGTSSEPKCADLTNLVFCDDFDGAANTAPDSSKWHILSGSSWGGQCFKNLPENISQDGQGNLKMTLINKSTTQCTDSDGYPSSVTSGGMDTQNKQYFKYGKFEIRAKLACAQSVWGAIWTSVGTGPAWPEGGEIDIWETFNNDGRIKNSIHAGNPHWQIGKYIPAANPAYCNDYHVYGIIWRNGSIKCTLDGVVRNEITSAEANGRPWPFDTYDQRLIIDLQYGGPGRPNAGAYDVTELPDSMLIDYVHIFQ